MNEDEILEFTYRKPISIKQKLENRSIGFFATTSNFIVDGLGFVTTPAFIPLTKCPVTFSDPKVFKKRSF
jgi:hypothetical protein